MKRLAYTLHLALGLASATALPALSQTLDNATVSLKPALVREAQVRPKVVLSVDTSGSMRTRAYSRTFDPTQVYIGIFDERLCYTYDDAPGKGFFIPDTQRNLDGSCSAFSGNMLNWLSMRRMDILREILIGSRVEVLSQGQIYSRRHFANLDLQPSGYIKTVDLSRTGASTNLLTGAQLAAQSPHDAQSGAHLCSDRIIISKTAQTNTQTLAQWCQNAGTNNDYQSYRLRVRYNKEPTGLIQQSYLQFDYGVAVFSPNGDAGTLRPCYQPTTGGINELCLDTYAGAPLADIIEVIESYPTQGNTPIAETLFEIGGYIKQTPHGGPQSALFNTRNRNGSYALAERGAEHWDPYYSPLLKAKVPCTPVFVVNINDGSPTQDFQNAAQNLTPIWGGLQQNEMVDSVAWSLRGDCRQDLPGAQDVRSFFVFADLSGDTDGDSLRKLREAAAIGGMDLKQTTTGFETVDKPFFADGTNREPFSNARSGFDRKPLPSPPRSWDKDGDGEPDNLLLANSPDALKASLLRVLGLINDQARAGGGAAASTSSKRGDGLVVQALMYPKRQDAAQQESVTWAGSLHTLFIDSEGRYREDGNRNGRLDDLAQDPEIRYTRDPQTGTQITRYGANGQNLGTAPLANLRPLWRAEDQWLNLSNALLAAQRAYDDTAPGRHIFTLAPDALFSGSAGKPPATLSFTADQFSADHQALFGIDCARLRLTDNQCNRRIEETVNYVRGLEFDNTRNRSLTNPQGQRQRFILGDIANASPLMVGPPSEHWGETDPSYRAFAERYAKRRHVLYVGANDGMLHAFNSGFWDGDDKIARLSLTNEEPHPLGKELWAYVPGNLLPHLQWLNLPDYQHVFYVDGSPKAFDVKSFTPSNRNPDGWGTILVTGTGLGGYPVEVTYNGNTQTLGSSYLVFDITDPETPPRLLAEIRPPNLGYSLGTPTVIHEKGRWRLAFGTGPTQATDASSAQSAALYFFDLQRLTLSAPETIPSTNAFTGDLGAVDWDQDGNTDHLYFGLTERISDGRLIQFDLNQGVSRVFFNPNRAITTEPTAFISSQDRWLFFGTGKLKASNDNSLSEQQYFYGLKVDDSGRANAGRILDTRNILLKKDDKKVLQCQTGCPAGVKTYPELSKFMADDAVGGWRFALETGTSANAPSGRHLSKSLVAFQRVFFLDYVPPVSLCGELGKTYLHGLDFLTGTAGPHQIFSQFADQDELKGSTFVGDGLQSGLFETGSQNRENSHLNFQGEDGSLNRIEITPPPKPTATAQGRVSWRELAPID